MNVQIRQHISGCVKNLRILSNINQTLFNEVIIINKLMKLNKMFTVKRRNIIYKIQTRFIRLE